jgi:hypothetical protein
MRPRIQDVIRIDPADGTEKVVSTLKPTPVSDTGVLATRQLAYFDGSLFALEPTTQENGYVGFDELVEVKVDGGGTGPR